MLILALKDLGFSIFGVKILSLALKKHKIYVKNVNVWDLV